jgi:hypothetical protein
MTEIIVVTDALRAEAVVWDDQSAVVGAVSAAVDPLRLNRLRAGLFQGIVDEYAAVCDKVEDRCAEGKRRMAEIASALRLNADAYDRRDADVAENVDNAY